MAEHSQRERERETEHSQRERERETETENESVFYNDHLIVTQLNVHDEIIGIVKNSPFSSNYSVAYLNTRTENYEKIPFSHNFQHYVFYKYYKNYNFFYDVAD
jgi:hypothetical protein